MADFYTLLEIPRNADSTQIRAAYKRLAFHYHPDLNPGNARAEELFKQINEAYHTLSDPIKKSRYDARLNSYQGYTDYSETQWRAYRHQQYQRWRQAHEKRYTFDKEYFKIQGLAFLTFLIIAGFCYGLIHTVNYFYALKQQEEARQNTLLVNQVNALFTSGREDDAFSMVSTLMKQYPFEYRFVIAYDSLLDELRKKADKEFDESNLGTSLNHLKVIKKYEMPTRFETLRRIAICQYNLAQYDSALLTLKELHHVQPWNFELVYQIGLINLVNTNNAAEALDYFTLGKRMFKESLSRKYGQAFEIVMNPADAPDSYYDLFEARAKANLILANYEEAITDCNWAVFLRPKKAEGYKLRALSKAGAGQYRTLCSDLQVARKLGAQGINELQRQYCR
ncbi:MAG: DnaJ domain-containing protein [Flammeovirgaceae bacterium]|nr:MAG: DnaJ domain-containing protein [Flammeovirgaceae bacterium]